VLSFAIANRWYGEGATGLRDLVEGVLAGRRFKRLGPAWDEASLEGWRVDASFLS